MHLRHGRAHVLGRDVEIDDAATAWRRDVGHMLYARRCPSTAYAQNGFALAARTYLCLNRTIERCVCTVC